LKKKISWNFFKFENKLNLEFFNFFFPNLGLKRCSIFPFQIHSILQYMLDDIGHTSYIYVKNYIHMHHIHIHTWILYMHLEVGPSIYLYATNFNTKNYVVSTFKFQPLLCKICVVYLLFTISVICATRGKKKRVNFKIKLFLFFMYF